MSRPRVRGANLTDNAFIHAGRQVNQRSLHCLEPSGRLVDGLLPFCIQPLVLRYPQQRVIEPADRYPGGETLGGVDLIIGGLVPQRAEPAKRRLSVLASNSPQRRQRPSRNLFVSITKHLGPPCRQHSTSAGLPII